MPLTMMRPAPPALPPLESLVLDANDLPDFRRIFADRETTTNEAIASRSAAPELMLKRLETWGRVDGYAVRFVPAVVDCSPTLPIVVDSSASRFVRGAGALQALMDHGDFADDPRFSRLFPRNIADNTECVHGVFEEDGERFGLYRVDFRVLNIVGSVGVVWRWPHGGPLQALRITEKQVSRVRTAIRRPARAASQQPVEFKQRQLAVVGEA